MAKIKYRIQFVGSGGNATFPVASILSAYLAGATGTPETRIYLIAASPPAFAPYPLTKGGVDGPVIVNGDYYVDYKDGGVLSKRLAKVKLIPYASSCWTDAAYVNPAYELIRFETYVMIRAHTSAPAPAQVSIDGGLSWKSMVFNGVGTEAVFTDTEIAAMGFSDTIPTIQTRRSLVSDLRTIGSFQDPFNASWPSANFTRATISNTTGLVVGQVVSFYNSPLYPSGSIVEISPGSSFVFQHSFIGSSSGAYIATLTNCVATIAEEMFIGSPSFDVFAVSEAHTNETSAPANDGTITLTPTGGSGNFSYAWTDGSTAQNRSGLPAGSYQVSVTDSVTAQIIVLTIGITEPAPTPIPNGSYFDVPKMQSLRFVKEAVIDNCNTFQDFDNTLFCKMVFFGVKIRTPFYQKACKCDILTIQVHSNFPTHKVELMGLSTGPGFDDSFDVSFGSTPAVKNFNNMTLKQQLTGLTSTFPFYFSNSGPADPAGTSRVNFLSGTIPTPVDMGDTFSAINNADGFNRTYAIVGISNDPLLGAPYLLVSLVYNAPSPTSSASAVFTNNTLDFDIYETVLNLQDVAEGFYFVRIRGVNIDGSYTQMVSEPIHLKAAHPGTNFIEFRNFDNDADVVYTTGITHKIRLESKLQKPIPGRADENYRESNGSPVKLSSKPQRKYKLDYFNQPFYRLELLSVLFGFDQIIINKVEYHSDEGTGEPQNRDFYLLANGSVTIEQKQWFQQYNGDDLGNVDPGYILTQYGYIQRT